MTFAPSKDSDQPGHPPSLIRVFAIRNMKHWVLSYPLSALWRFLSDCGWPGLSESSLGAQVILLVLSWAGSNSVTCIIPDQNRWREKCGTIFSSRRHRFQRQISHEPLWTNWDKSFNTGTQLIWGLLGRTWYQTTSPTSSIIMWLCGRMNRKLILF